MNNTEKWDYRFLNLAKEVSTWSKDPSTKCGAVLVQNRNQIISLGFNGMPQRIKNDSKYLEERETKLKTVLHSEINAIRFSVGRSLENSTCYTFPFMPCSACAAVLIQYGISRVVAPQNREVTEGRWKESCDLAKELFKDSGVVLEELPYSVIKNKYSITKDLVESYIDRLSPECQSLYYGAYYLNRDWPEGDTLSEEFQVSSAIIDMFNARAELFFNPGLTE